MFANFFRQNKKLEKEKNNLLKENQKLRKMNWNNNLKITKVKILATKTIKKLDEIQNIDRKGIRKRLDTVVIKYGLHSIETRKISDEIDIKINEYYKSIEQVKYPKNSNMNEYKEKSYQKIKEIVLNTKKFPTVKQWDKIAKEEGFLSHISLEYMMKTNWNNLRVKTLRELNIEI